MSRTEADTLDLFGAVARASAEAASRRPGPALGPVARCLCGSDDTRGRILAQPIDIADDDVTAERNEGTRFCQGCHHGIAHGAMRVTRHFTATSTVRDHYHPECVRF